ncbi:Uncharacterised protein [Klebsiella pneumoniae]|uniref:Uncharacterized protein n=1 Tax=Klebsiella pneumoniae TaxID=573 RepID=A0A2X3J1E1_KLEPN|nr:Uncharacterised protein [Klebsiella pneumoniae]
MSVWAFPRFPVLKNRLYKLNIRLLFVLTIIHPGLLPMIIAVSLSMTFRRWPTALLPNPALYPIL